MDIKNIRTDYTKEELLEGSILANPIEQFRQWLQEAIQQEVQEPTAMTLSTVNTAGKPSARIVLLKHIYDTGFVFFTNYESRKGQELAQNPNACLTFHWAALERQVRIEGVVEKVSDDASAAYFQSRPRGSQIGAIASPQSQRIANRSVLEEKVTAVQETQAADEPLTRPTYWGGYLLKPNYMEFWQGRSSRLHDRIVYEAEANDWKTHRLAP